MSPKPSVKIGDIFKSKECGKVKIVSYASSKDVSVKFLRTGYIKRKLKLQHVKQGSIKDPMQPSVFGIGFIGGEKTTFRGSKIPAIKWRSMLTRCYSGYSIHNKHYSDAIVCKRWHNLQNFAHDIMSMPNWNNPAFVLDKDLRIIDNRIYGPKFCSFVPVEINALFTGFSSVNKESKLPRGVFINGSKFVAQLRKNNKPIVLGRFDSVDAASKAYLKAKKTLARRLAIKHRENLLMQVFDNLYYSKFLEDA